MKIGQTFLLHTKDRKVPITLVCIWYTLYYETFIMRVNLSCQFCSPKFHHLDISEYTERNFLAANIIELGKHTVGISDVPIIIP